MIKMDDKVVKLISEEIRKSDLIDFVKKDKDFEKRVKTIVSDVVVDMFRVLYQHNGIFKSLGRG